MICSFDDLKFFFTWNLSQGDCSEIKTVLTFWICFWFQGDHGCLRPPVWDFPWWKLCAHHQRDPRGGKTPGHVWNSVGSWHLKGKSTVIIPPNGLSRGIEVWEGRAVVMNWIWIALLKKKMSAYFLVCRTSRLVRLLDACAPSTVQYCLFFPHTGPRGLCMVEPLHGAITP